MPNKLLFLFTNKNKINKLKIYNLCVDESKDQESSKEPTITPRSKIHSTSSIGEEEKVLGEQDLAADTANDSDTDSDKEKKCLRLLKNKSDDIERYDHVQFLIREILPANTESAQTSLASSTMPVDSKVSALKPEDAAAKEPPDDWDFVSESKFISNNLLTLFIERT